MRVAVAGLGKLGSPLAAVLASKGHDVLGVDVDAKVVRLLDEGTAPVAEPGLQELIDGAGDRLAATVELEAAADCDVSILLVPTPSDERGAFSNEFLLHAIERIGQGLADREGYHVVVVASTVMPGSCDGELRSALEVASGRTIGESLGLCYSPEFIALGNVIRDMLEPDMVLIGESDERAGRMLEELYGSVCENDPPFRRMSLVNAELTKIAVNTYVTMKISYANTLADLCERLPDADVDVVTGALGLDTRIGSKYLRGAIAYGGPCFPRDNKAFATLARTLGTEAPLAEATDAVNDAQTDRLARIVHSLAGVDASVGILGLAYKPDTGVVEESPGVALAETLRRAGVDRVNVYDPIATDAALELLGNGIRPCHSLGELAEASDLVVIATPWQEFKDIAQHTRSTNGRRRPIVVDCWRLLPDAYDGAIELVRLGRPLGFALATTGGERCHP